MDSTSFWEDSTIHNNVKYESTNISNNGSGSNNNHLCKEEQNIYRYCDGNLNFTTVATSEDDEYGYHKKKISRDPMSHRIIEKRRRDRMNNCLADLSRLIPADYLKKGRGRIEKTEIIEMAIKHMKHLQSHTCNHIDGCDMDRHRHIESEESYSPPESIATKSQPIIAEHYRLGYHECLSETMHFLVEVEGFFAGDSLCVQLINHLQKHCDKILKGDILNAPRTHYGENASTSSTESSGGKVTDTGSSGGSGSGSSSDGGERHSGTMSNVEENYEGTTSQLRDILTSSNLSSHTQNRIKLSNESPSPSLSFNGSTAAENHSSSGSLYKFKNNIKQRFSAEHSNIATVNSEIPQSIGNKRRRSEEKRRSETLSDVPSPPLVKYQQPSSPSPPLSITAGVPIFALHSKGSFYIPLTVDYHLLAPFLAEFHNIDANMSTVVLHPVTISVNFQQPVSRLLKHPQSSPNILSPTSWNQTQNSYVSLPKWTTYVNERT